MKFRRLNFKRAAKWRKKAHVLVNERKKRQSRMNVGESGGSMAERFFSGLASFGGGVGSMLQLSRSNSSRSNASDSSSKVGSAVRQLSVRQGPPSVADELDLQGIGEAVASAHAADREHIARRGGHFFVPKAPNRQNTRSIPDERDVRIDRAIKDASKGTKARKYSKQTTIGRIMKAQWAPSSQDGQSDDFDSMNDDAEHLRHMEGFGILNPNARQRPLEGTHPVHRYECLVFKGGGAKGTIYPGAIRALEDAGIMPHIKRFAGASAGACVASLLAIGLSAKQLYRELRDTDREAEGLEPGAC